MMNLGVFVGVAVLFAWWAVSNIISVDLLEHPYHVSADFENAMGVLPNAEVTYLGTQVGVVNSVRRIPGGVRITMNVKRQERIPADATAHIFRKSALGEQFIDFFPKPGSDGHGPSLRDGDHLPMSRTTIPIEFAEFLRAASRLVESIRPEAVHTVTHELAVALQGRTDDLRSLITGGDRLGEVFASRTETLDRLVAANTRLTRVLADHSPSLSGSLSDLHAVAQSLDEVKGDIGPLLERGNSLLEDLNPVVRDHRDSLSCLLEAVGQVVDEATTPARLSALGRLIDDAPVATEQLKDVLDIEGTPDERLHQWVRVDLVNDPLPASPDFVPDRPTPPPVASVDACNVSFADASAAAPPAPARGPASPVRGNALPVATLGAAVLVGAVRMTGRRVE